MILEFHNSILRRVALLYAHSAIVLFACIVAHGWRKYHVVMCAIAHNLISCGLSRLRQSGSKMLNRWRL